MFYSKESNMINNIETRKMIELLGNNKDTIDVNLYWHKI